jgi:hypothetical protein
MAVTKVRCDCYGSNDGETAVRLLQQRRNYGVTAMAVTTVELR